MELAKILPDGSVDIRFCSPILGEKMAQLREAGFLDYVPTEQPKADTGYVAVDSFEVVDGRIVQSWSTKIDPTVVQSRIAELKEQLEESDYKVTKCYEASLVGESLPYDIAELHRERQSIRDEINRLEAMI
ncbi:MAG: hypothetical protein NC401_04205 [Ruminococcus sp.]|nr:hypothetical protein [Ruminococcus sp.]